MNELNEYMLTADRYLKIRGYGIVDTIDDLAVIVADDEGTIVFVDVAGCSGPLSHHVPAMPRHEFEDMIHHWFKTHDEPREACIRYDIVEVHVIGENRALISHVRNAEFEEVE